MLTYLILTTRAIVTAAVILGLIFANKTGAARRKEKITVNALTIAGFIAAFIISVFENNTNMVNSANLNMVVYITGVISFILFMVFSLDAFKDKKAGILGWIFLGIASLDIIIGAFPDLFGYPQQVYQSEKTVLSTDFLVNMIGVIFGVILAVVLFFASKRTGEKAGTKNIKLMLGLEFLLIGLKDVAGILSVLQQRRIIVSNHAVFTYIVFVKNHSDLFLALSLIIVALCAAVLFVKSFKLDEPYENPAQLRRIKAGKRNIRRWSVAFGVCFVLSVLNITVVEAMNTHEVVLSPIEETDFDDENVYVPFELVSDGHLHRFAYTTEDGTDIRFIVIKKPNSSSYGVGLDACDICGETGYYEKDGQVVCNLCDVVMNINTIGFKGGCNPIVIPYEISNGQIIVPIEGLLEYESEFK